MNLISSDKTAIICGNESITYNQLSEKISTTVGKGANRQVVGVSGPTSIDLIVEYLSLIKQGRIPCMIPYKTQKATLELHQARLENFQKMGVDSAIGPDEVLFVQASSGTTNSQKGFGITISDLQTQLKTYSSIIGVNDKSVIVSWLPLYHDMGLITSLFLPLLTSATVVVIPTFDWLANPQSLFDAVDAHGGTHVWMPNFAFEHMTNQAKGIKNKECRFINCGEVCMEFSMKRFMEKFSITNVSCCYAMAENVFALTQSEDIYSCGSPLPGVDIEIQENQIYFRSNCKHSFVLQSGTFSPVDKSELYATGDVGEFNENILKVTGRTVDWTVVNGKNLYLGDVDLELQKLNIHPGRAVSFPVPVGGTNEIGILYEGDESVAKIRNTIFFHFDISAKVMRVPSGTLIKTSSGKLSRHQNAAIFQQRIKAQICANEFLRKKQIFDTIDFDTSLISSGLLDSFLHLNLLIALAKTLYKRAPNWKSDYRSADTLEEILKIL